MKKYKISAKSQNSTRQTERKKLFVCVKYYWSKLPAPEFKQRPVSKGTTISEGTIHLHVQVSSKLATKDMITSAQYFGSLIKYQQA